MMAASHRMITCGNCKGKGWVTGLTGGLCPICAGKGTHMVCVLDVPDFVQSVDIPIHKETVSMKQRTDEPALRYDGGKSRVDLIDPEFIIALGAHYAVGAKKYAERNWEKGMSYSRCYASAQRHMLAFWAGEELDEETGSPHVIAAAWNMAALHHYMSRPELRAAFDDRPASQKGVDADPEET